MAQESSHTRRTTMRYSIPFCLSVFLCFAIVAIAADSPARFERTYNPQRSAHLTISNVNGSIHVVSWDKKTILARASADPYVSIEDQFFGDDLRSPPSAIFDWAARTSMFPCRLKHL